MENMSQLFTQIRAVPHFEGGQSIGFRLFAIRRGSLFDKIGLKNGDIITSINGTEMTDPGRAMGLMQELRDVCEPSRFSHPKSAAGGAHVQYSVVSPVVRGTMQWVRSGLVLLGLLCGVWGVSWAQAPPHMPAGSAEEDADAPAQAPPEAPPPAAPRTGSLSSGATAAGCAA